MATPTAITNSPVRATASPVKNGGASNLQSFLQSGQLSGDLKNLVSLLGSQSSSGITLEQLLSPSSLSGRQATPTSNAPITPQSTLQWSTGRKRGRNTSDTSVHLKRRRVAAKQSADKQQGKGLRHFSQRVCEKVREKGNTTYNEVADELVKELSESESANGSDMSIDQKNIRRRVYDALNVLMAMNIISKEKKDIRWIGLPTNSAQECQHVEEELAKVEKRVADKRSQVESLLIQILSFKNLMKRNRERVTSLGGLAQNSSISLPFILANTSKKTTIDCSISSDKSEYVFSFDNAFELHNDIEVLKKMGLDCGLHSGTPTEEEVKRAKAILPKAFESTLDDIVSSKREAAAVPATPISTPDTIPAVSPLTPQSIANSPLVREQLMSALSQTLRSSSSSPAIKPSSPVIVPLTPMSGIPSPQAVTALVTSVMRGTKVPISKSPGVSAKALLHSHCPSSQPPVPASPLVKSAANVAQTQSQSPITAKSETSLQATRVVNVSKLSSPQHCITSLLQQLQQNASLSKLISTAASSSASRQLFTNSAQKKSSDPSTSK